MKSLFGRNVDFGGDAAGFFDDYESKIAQICIGSQLVEMQNAHLLSLDHLIIHASMMINLGNGKKWSVAFLQRTLNEAARILRAKPSLKIGVVTHIGKGADVSVEGVVDQIKRLIIPEGVTLYLENAAGQGHEIGINLDELIDIFDELPSKIKLCIDTQHAFAAGFFAWKGEDEIVDFFETMEIYLPGRLELIHLNDSKTTFGSRVDRHENLLKGHIWKHASGEKELKYLLDCLIKRKIPLILETPKPSEDLIYLLNLYQKSSSSSSSKKMEGRT